MATYEYGRIAKLAGSLANAGVDASVAAQILEGGEGIRKGTSPAQKACWMQQAMGKMDALLDAETRRRVREACACCVGGRRLEISARIARDHPTLEARISAANEAKFVFGHSVTLQTDGSILVQFAPDGQDAYRCVCLPQARGAVSLTYCACCGGHVKHHLQIALGRKLACTVLSSALASEGTHPCRFRFTFEP